MASVVYMPVLTQWYLRSRRMTLPLIITLLKHRGSQREAVVVIVALFACLLRVGEWFEVGCAT